MSVEPFKYLLQPVALERDEHGRILRELPGETLTLYQVDQLTDAGRQFEMHLMAMQNGKGEAMPIEETTQTAITCDNNACPGNKLDPTDRKGWLFVTHEVYGEPSAQHVFCSASCLSVASGDPELGFEPASA